MARFYQPEIAIGSHYLRPEESHHCVKVLRHKVGDVIEVLDGNGSLYTVRITKADPKQCNFEIVDATVSEKPPFHIHIAIAPTKNLDRMEWFVEKAVEIGVQEITFMVCRNSERKILKLNRLERKAVSAMKQSQQFYLPKINPLTPYQQLLPELTAGQKFIAFVDFDNPSYLKEVAPREKYCVLIGPEGDFTDDELNFAISQGFTKVSLGPSRLRTETAGLVACHILNLING